MSLILNNEQQSNGNSGPGTRGNQLPFKGYPGGGSAMATIQDDDERLLARIGYKQVGVVATP
ncbi:hypothetical protein BDFG_04792 [Blastomyces dermatitidis ATCC 26199]|nr:hypothetical protein BDFG_04792 [Blastomyces dermatitidis ATCC 26199]